jgi:DNA-binding NtrC family response regulator
MEEKRTVQVLVADDEEGMRFMLSQLLGKEGYTVKLADDGDVAVEMCRLEDFDVVILDVKMPRMNGIDALTQIRQIRPDTPVLIITAHGSAPIAHQAIAAGAYDYFSKPLDNTELRIVVKRALERRNSQLQINHLQHEGQILLRQVETLETQRDTLAAQLNRIGGFGNIIGSNPKMVEIYSLIQRVAPRDVTVLILGESGTGKELIAQAIVNNSPRRSMPFIKLNCAAIPEALLESELFGHERGAFTGALLTKPGKFELADKGTLFLDEIGDLPANLQAKLLRVLQEREFERVGGTKTMKVDLRLITATNARLAQKVAEGRFREDLYFRLNVIPIELPPLRERVDDLPKLIDHFVRLYCRQFGKERLELAPDAMEAFLNYSWPGNIRELENAIQRACILAQDTQITRAVLPPQILDSRSRSTDMATATPVPGDSDRALILPEWFDDFSIPLSRKIDDLTLQAEKKLILRALAQTDHRRQAAADLLRISRKGLHNKMVKYGLMDDNQTDG